MDDKRKATPSEMSSAIKPITVCIIGCGQRGKIYASIMTKMSATVVAIAEPRPRTRQLVASAYHLAPEQSFENWENLLDASKKSLEQTGKRLADAAVIAVQDWLHAQVVCAFAQQGYHILCEKPMATSIPDCIRMADSITNANIIFGMGHVMRYAPYVHEITAIVRSGKLGPLINAVHIEPVGYYHFAHSYVRGAWNNEAESSFSLMTKCCHDVDLLCHWFSPAIPTKIVSFGSLSHFRKEGKPAAAGTATRCLDCAAESTCPYSAKKIYLDPVRRGNTAWPICAITDGPPDTKNVMQALQDTSYGRCVYESGNDVADHQVVNIEFSTGATASLTMVAFTERVCQRVTRLHFARGEIVGDMRAFTVTDFATRVSSQQTPRSLGGHGGGDTGLSEAFVRAVGEQRQELLHTTVEEILKSHLTVFAAEKSRKTNTIIDCREFETAAREMVQESA